MNSGKSINLTTYTFTHDNQLTGLTCHGWGQITTCARSFEAKRGASLLVNRRVPGVVGPVDPGRSFGHAGPRTLPELP